MSYNPDPNKEANIEVHFFNKPEKENYPSLQFSITDVQRTDSQNHLGLISESRITKCNKIMGLMKKTFLIFSKKNLLTI